MTKPHIVTMRRVIDAESPEHAAQRFLQQVQDSLGARVELYVTPQAEPGARVTARLPAGSKTTTSHEQDLMIARCALMVDRERQDIQDQRGYCTGAGARI